MARAGAFRDRIVIERQSDAGALDAYGNPSAAAWAAVPGLAFWGDLREERGREKLAAGRLEAPASAVLRFRRSAASAGVRAGDRVVARGATWAILSPPIDPDGRGRLLEVTLERGGAVN